MKKLFLTFLLSALIILPGLSCTQTNQTAAPITLSYWRVFEDENDFSQIIAAYKALHPNVKIEYKKLRYEEYEQALLEAWAEDRGPDIFSIQNTWLKKYQSKIYPLPKQTSVDYQSTQKTWLKTYTTVEKKTSKSLSYDQLKSSFVPVAVSDVYREEQIWALPLSVDTLVMYYNRDLLNAANIPLAPQNWAEFQEDSIKITKKDKSDNISIAGSALGLGSNIARSMDIVSLLMMQNGAKMSDGQGNPIFNRMPVELKGRSELPGAGALTFYTDFANPAKESYCWNDKMPNSFDAFLAGKVGFFFGYSYHLPLLKAQAPNLNLGIAAVPQIDANAPTNYANYWVETVSKKSNTTQANWAWDFLQFATKAEQAKKFLASAKKPAALLSLINDQKQDPELQPFADSLLTAKSWYQGRDANAAEKYFIEMIDDAAKRQTALIDSLNLGAQKISQTIK